MFACLSCHRLLKINKARIRSENRAPWTAKARAIKRQRTSLIMGTWGGTQFSLKKHKKGKVIPLGPVWSKSVGRVIALLFHDRDTRRVWVVSGTPRPHFTPGKDPVPIVQEAGWAPGPVWTGVKSRPHRDFFFNKHSIPDRPARSQTLYRLSYPAHTQET